MAITTPNMALKRWDQPNDPFSYTELSSNFNSLDLHDHSAGKGVQIPTTGIVNLAVTNTKLGANAVDQSKLANASVGLAQLIDANVSAAKIDATLATLMGITTASVRRGRFVQATNGTRTNAAYGALSNGPDVVTGVVLPTDGLIFVVYKAQMRAPVSQTASAAIFLGANQLRNSVDNGSPALQEATATSSGVPRYSHLFTVPGGLNTSTSLAGDVSDVTTGQSVGAPATQTGGMSIIFAAASTYDVSVQYKTPSGTLDSKERHLWVWTMGF